MKKGIIIVAMCVVILACISTVGYFGYIKTKQTQIFSGAVETSFKNDSVGVANTKDDLYNLKYRYDLPKLNYGFNSLEPYIDEMTMKIHYLNHHKAYIDKLNAAVEKEPKLKEKTLGELLTNIDAIPKDVRETIKNNGGGHYNHSLFWQSLAPNAPEAPKGKLLDRINKDFGSFDKFKEQFTNAASSVFGSGWAWLVLDNKGKLEIITTANQDTPISIGKYPLLLIDVWEHAYYLKHQNRRAEYINDWWNVVNWSGVEKRYDTVSGNM